MRLTDLYDGVEGAIVAYRASVAELLSLRGFVT